jgi:hypothetical protein
LGLSLNTEEYPALAPLTHLLKMGEKNSDGGQFFTPREVVRAMVGTLDPGPGETL